MLVCLSVAKTRRCCPPCVNLVIAEGGSGCESADAERCGGGENIYEHDAFPYVSRHVSLHVGEGSTPEGSGEAAVSGGAARAGGSLVTGHVGVEHARVCRVGCVGGLVGAGVVCRFCVAYFLPSALVLRALAPYSFHASLLCRRHNTPLMVQK